MPWIAVALASLAAAVPAGSAAAAPAHRAAPNGAVVSVSASRYGRTLVDGRGHTLYLFTREHSRRSRCYGACAQAWPPLYTRGAPRARGGAKQRLLGTTSHHGRRQVTYAGHPLYHYVGEKAAGQIFCQAANEYGGLWLIVRPSGVPVR